jgi:hypothetical protein
LSAIEHAPIVNKAANEILVRHAKHEWFINTLQNCNFLRGGETRPPRSFARWCPGESVPKFTEKEIIRQVRSKVARYTAFLAELFAVRGSPPLRLGDSRGMPHGGRKKGDEEEKKEVFF